MGARGIWDSDTFSRAATTKRNTSIQLLKQQWHRNPFTYGSSMVDIWGDPPNSSHTRVKKKKTYTGRKKYR